MAIINSNASSKVVVEWETQCMYKSQSFRRFGFSFELRNAELSNKARLIFTNSS